jgi:FKBP-type peptidyl-prolyl cis-trans isomerase FkpA
MKKQWMVLGLVALASVAGCKRAMRGRGGRGAGGGAAVSPSNDTERTLYALGVFHGQRLQQFNLNPREAAIVARGMQDQLSGGHTTVNMREMLPRIQELADSRSRAASQENVRRGNEFAARAAAEPGAQRTASGLVFRTLEEGNGPTPTREDTVTVHYRGRLIDGTEFDSSFSRNEPATFSLSGVIPCWTEGVALMKVGSRARLVCPPDIAYGDRGQRQIPPGSTLDFEVQLISIAPRPQAADADGGAAATTPTATTGAADPHGAH